MNREKNILQRSKYSRCFYRHFEDLRFLIANINQLLKKIILYEEEIQTFIDEK
jgi:hypothetical protein